jgi:glycosyltransferase involved in cell wall biosynthesis
VISAALRILTNIERFPPTWRSSAGVAGTARIAQSPWEFVAQAPDCDVILIDCDPALTLKISALFLIFWFRRKPIVALDLVLRRPTTGKAKLATKLKKLFLSRVDYFIHYFRQLDHFQKYFGIGPERSGYVPFKSNIKGRCAYTPKFDGEYILCFGSSERDFDTFIRVVGQLPYPAAIPRPNFSVLRMHSSKFTVPLTDLPPNLQLLENDGSLEASVRIMENAKMVVLPIVPERIGASGIGTYLTAMVLGKCVIVTEGPGATDVLTDQALFVPPGDAQALADMIRLVWEDRGLRERVARSGNRYAESCGGIPELRQRVLDKIVERFGSGAAKTDSMADISAEAPRAIGRGVCG